MSRITRAIAEEVASKLLAKKREKNEKRYKEIQDIVTAIQESKVPRNIMLAYNDPATKSFIETHSNVNLNGPGLNYDRVRLSRSVPHGSESTSIILDDATSLLISKKFEVYRKHQNYLNDLEVKTTETLVALRSYKKVHDLFPDAAKFLPPVQTTCADLQCISSIVKEINSADE